MYISNNNGKFGLFLTFVVLLSLLVLLSMNTIVAASNTTSTISTASINSSSKSTNTVSTNVSIDKKVADKSVVVKGGNSYSISYFDKTVGGNVLKNGRIAKNMPKASLSRKIVSMTKKGSVVLKFGDGGGPKLLMCAGIHGNEVSANIATLKFIEKIANKKICGSLYVIPFIIPRDTEINSRAWYYSKKKTWVDPNEVAHISGTPGNKIVKFALKNNISYILDIHTGGGIASYKKGFVYANEEPVKKGETKWLNYVKKAVNPVVKYNVPKKGYIRYYSKLKGISTLTFEVERDIGAVSYWSKVEYNMLIHACKYFKFF